MAADARRLAEHVFRREFGRLVAMLVRSLGLRRVDAAEDLVQDALVAALESWSDGGVPDNPTAWLLVVAQRKAFNRFRHEQLAAHKLACLAAELESYAEHPEPIEATIRDGKLRLMFACARPELSRESAIAFMLRTLCGFGPREIAAAFGASHAAVEKRLVRARRHLRTDLDLDAPADPARIDDVTTTLYLLFNEGYKATGPELIRRDLCVDAIQTACDLADAFPDESSVAALIALMYFNLARFPSRVDGSGLQVRLFDQDRSRWDWAAVDSAWTWLGASQRGDKASRFHLEAGIVAEYVTAPTLEAVAWDRVVGYFDQLRGFGPSAVRDLNRAVAISHLRGPTQGLRELAALPTPTAAIAPHLVLAVRADLQLRARKLDEARATLLAAAASAPAGPDRRLLEARLADLDRG